MTRAKRGSYRVVPGQRFGRLTVISEFRIPPSPSHAGRLGPRAAICECDCGTVKTVRLVHLCRGKTVSCGCFLKDQLLARNEGHGYANHSQYSRWASMLQRCHNPSNPKYPQYGGRGISVCEEWHDVRNFVAYLELGVPVEPPYMGLWEASEPPPGYSLDRIDNDGNYEPGNIRWADMSVQNLNQQRQKRDVTCVVDMCNSRSRARGLCNRHYLRRASLEVDHHVGGLDR